MGQKRWEQIKRFFHVSPPSPEGIKCQIFEKLEPLTTPLGEAFRKYVIPGSMVSFDEMMVRFTGRSAATVKLPGKPIPEGFKIMSFCQYGYCYSFMFTSPGYFFSLPSRTDHRDISLSKTSECVLYLTRQLPLQTRRFCLFLDNYFTNIPLLQVLRRLGIAAAGTARSNSKDYPVVHKKVDKKKGMLPFNFISGIVVDSVLSIVWQDKNLVRFLTTAHSCSNEDVDDVDRRRPRAYNAFLKKAGGKRLGRQSNEEANAP
jgi:hypothetical protein